MKIIQITSNQNGEVVLGLGDDGNLYELWYRLKPWIGTEQKDQPEQVPALGYRPGYWSADIIADMWVPTHEYVRRSMEQQPGTDSALTRVPMTPNL